jgi:N-acetylglucosaminyl-diphospho-decaprenol L-rhamnosyltransferase
MVALVVIVNYRTGGLVIECLRSLAGQVASLLGTRVSVVDNASGDGSVEQIRAAIDAEGWGGWVSLQPLARNGGFAFGNNAAIRAALALPKPPRYVVLLNPDTIAQPGALGELVRFMDANPKVGIAGSRLENLDGSVQCSSHRAPTPLSELADGAQFDPLHRLLKKYIVSPPIPDHPCACDWVSGASLIARREVFNSIGLFDEGYFLYYEEVDFCSRARRAGWPVWYVPDARVVHLEGESTEISTGGRRRPSYWFDSRRRFFAKQYGTLGLFAADFLWGIGRFSLWLRSSLRMGGDLQAVPPHFAGDLLCGDCRAILFGRVPTRGEQQAYV